MTILNNLKDLEMYETALTAEVLFLLASLVKFKSATEIASAELK